MRGEILFLLGLVIIGAAIVAGALIWINVAARIAEAL